MHSCLQISKLIIKTARRDKLLHAVAAVGLLLIFTIPAFSLFSMRQVQELSITIATSVLSFVLLVVTLLMGASSIWRDIEKKYTISILGLPLSRQSYLMGKFLGITAIVVGIACVLGLASFGAIKIAASQYNADIPILWGTIVVAITLDTLKYLMLLSIALLFSAVSTSFYFPFFSTLSIYLVGTASQEVNEYINGSYGEGLSPVVHFVANLLYFLVPNFSAFNLKVYAIYSLPLNPAGLALTLLYFVVYTGIVLILATWVFSRRELS